MSGGLPADDPTVVTWARTVLEGMVPRMESSEAAITVVPSGGVKDVKDVLYWTELGAMICLDKPIIIVAMPDVDIPERLRRVADEVVYLPYGVSPEASALLRQAIDRVHQRYH